MKLKKYKRFLIILTILVIIFLILTLIYKILMKNGGFRYLYKQSEELALEEVFSTNYKEINIDSYLSDISVNLSTDNNIKVIFYGKEDYITLNEKNNQLYIDVVNKKCIGFCLKTDTSKIELYLPSNYSELVEIKNKYGDITIGDIIAANYNIDSSYGNISILSGNFAKIKNYYGDIKLDNVDKTNITSSTGNIDIDVVSEITIDNDHGDILIKNINKYANIANDCADIKIDNILIEKDSFIKNRYGNITISETGDFNLDTKTKFKEVKLVDDEDTITLYINNTSGSIDINKEETIS